MWIPLPARSKRSPSADERSAAMARLLAWARASGAHWDGIEFRVEADGSARGIATRALATGEPIITLPRRLMMIDGELEDSPTGTLAFGFEPRSRDALAAWLSLEVNEAASPWRAYLDTLPVQLSELPMFRSPDELAALAGTAAHSLAADTNRDVCETYERFPPELRARLSLADFAWGRAIVMSRAFHAPGSFEPRVALLPLVDVLNHRTDDTAWSYSPYDGNLVVRMERSREAGDEVHFSYGNRSNTHLLVHYGFTLPDNPTNEAIVVFEQPPDTRIAVRIANMVDHRLARALSIARLCVCDPTERDRILATLTEPSNIPVIDLANEQAAFDLLAKVAREARAALDAPLLEANGPWERTCLLVREGERAILDQIVEFATSAREFAGCADLVRLRATADAIPADATGAARMLRHYVQDLADVLASA